jgi:hypothetical protein
MPVWAYTCQSGDALNHAGVERIACQLACHRPRVPKPQNLLGYQAMAHDDEEVGVGTDLSCFFAEVSSRGTMMPFLLSVSI